MARIVAIVVAVMLAATPAAALAADPPALLQDTATQQAPVPVQQTPTTQTTVDDGSIGTGELLLIGLGIAVLFGGIWFVISRDARRATAGRIRTVDGGMGEGRGGNATRAGHRTRRLSAAERKRRKRGRAR
jgi:hypothetical protein